MAHHQVLVTAAEARCVDVDEVIGKGGGAEAVPRITMIVSCFDDAADLAMHGETADEIGCRTGCPTGCPTGYLIGYLIESVIEMRTETALLSLSTVY